MSRYTRLDNNSINMTKNYQLRGDIDWTIGTYDDVKGLFLSCDPAHAGVEVDVYRLVPRLVASSSFSSL